MFWSLVWTDPVFGGFGHLSCYSLTLSYCLVLLPVLLESTHFLDETKRLFILKNILNFLIVELVDSVDIFLNVLHLFREFFFLLSLRLGLFGLDLGKILFEFLFDLANLSVEFLQVIGQSLLPFLLLLVQLIRQFLLGEWCLSCLSRLVVNWDLDSYGSINGCLLGCCSCVLSWNCLSFHFGSSVFLFGCKISGWLGSVGWWASFVNLSQRCGIRCWSRSCFNFVLNFMNLVFFRFLSLGLFLSSIRKSLVGNWSNWCKLLSFELSEMLWLILLVSNLLLKSKQLGFFRLYKFMSMIYVILECLYMLFWILKDFKKFLLDWSIVLVFQQRLKLIDMALVLSKKFGTLVDIHDDCLKTFLQLFFLVNWFCAYDRF